MTMHVDAFENGVVKVVLISERKIVALVIFLDYRKGQIHTNLEDGGLRWPIGTTQKISDFPDKISKFVVVHR